ncbi:uncharacterized protein LOC121371038 isoform X2 [Gigantopelta aegis]|uniref:uncharacterized protein LOC121371038 isoform X2 n=1 Tax=Gigantopelta aegis TaxID=1735272 RepID=UPI001B887554|nr:uncharacterized protein LOC121371038 isoform X2 [Gigantopelta aegis]
MQILFLTFSLVFGLGASLAVTCTVTISQEYFDKYTTVTMGLIAAGSSFGTLVMAPLSQFLLDTVGWRNSLRVYAGTCGFSMLCNMLLIPISRPNKNRFDNVRTSPLRKLMEDLKLWKNRVFVVWTCAITCVMFGYYIPYVHMVSYAADCGISPNKASFLIMILGTSTASGRILFGKIIQFGLLDRVRMHQLSMVITGAGTMFLPMIKSFSGLAAYIVIVGLVDGCYVVLLPLLTCSLMGSEKMVLAWGFLIGTASFTFMLGPPVAGFLYDATGSYNLAFHIAGIPILSGAIIMFLIPWAQRTSETNNILQDLEVSRNLEDDEIVDFITLSKVPSLVSTTRSKITLAGSRRDNEPIQPESVSLMDADWGAYFVNNLNQVTFLPGNVISRPGMREADFDLQALERNEQVLSDMLRTSAISPVSPIRISGAAAAALIIGSSPRCQSLRSGSRRSDVINISSSTPRRHPRPFTRGRDDADEPGGCSNDAACQTNLTFSVYSPSNQFASAGRSPSKVIISPSKVIISPSKAFSPSRGLSPLRHVVLNERQARSGSPPTATTSSNESDSRYTDGLIIFDTIPEYVSKTNLTEIQNRTDDQFSEAASTHRHEQPIDDRVSEPASACCHEPPASSPSMRNRETIPTGHRPDYPQFYTSHNRKDYSVGPKNVAFETQPVDIPIPDVDVTDQCSDYEMFQMELPPSPPKEDECIPMMPSTPVPIRKRLPDSDTTQHTDDSLDNADVSDFVSQSTESPVSTQPPPQNKPASPSSTAGTVTNAETVPDVGERRSALKTCLATRDDPLVTTPEPPRRTASTTTVQPGAVFVMDPLSPPEADDNFMAGASSATPDSRQVMSDNLLTRSVKSTESKEDFIGPVRSTYSSSTI